MLYTFHNDQTIKDKYLAEVDCSTELGIPEWLARLENSFSNGMSSEKSKTWPRDFLDAVPVGISEEILERQVKAPLMVIILQSALESFDHAKYSDIKSVIDRSIALWQREDTDSEEFIKASDEALKSGWAAWPATSGAEDGQKAAAEAVLKAAWAAWATSAAKWTVGAAEATAKAAEWAAEAAAGSAVRAEKLDYFADELLRLLRETKHQPTEEK